MGCYWNSYCRKEISNKHSQAVKRMYKTSKLLITTLLVNGLHELKSWDRPSRGQCHGRPTTAVTQALLQCADELIQNDRQIIVSKLKTELWLSKGSVNITDALDYSKVCGHWVSWCLTDYHKTVRIEARSDLLLQGWW